MRIKRLTEHWIIPILTCVAVCIPPVSWMLSAFGYSCRSLISDEGLRWLCLHLSSLVATPITIYALLYAMAAGALEMCVRIYQKSANQASAWVTVLVALALCSIPILAFVMPDSPLRGISGSIWPSPLISGMPVIIALIILAAAILYSYLNLYLTSARKFCIMITWGIRRHAIWIVVAMLLSFIHGTLHYIL